VWCAYIGELWEAVRGVLWQAHIQEAVLSGIVWSGQCVKAVFVGTL